VIDDIKRIPVKKLTAARAKKELSKPVTSPKTLLNKISHPGVSQEGA